jgi:hypothetical protein
MLASYACRAAARNSVNIVDHSLSRAPQSNLVRKKGLEPLQPFGHQLLRLARLPIPPLPLNHTLASTMVLLNTLTQTGGAIFLQEGFFDRHDELNSRHDFPGQMIIVRNK